MLFWEKNAKISVSPIDSNGNKPQKSAILFVADGESWSVYNMTIWIVWSVNVSLLYSLLKKKTSARDTDVEQSLLPVEFRTFMSQWQFWKFKVNKYCWLLLNKMPVVGK